jgi:hypothetical protein
MLLRERFACSTTMWILRGRVLAQLRDHLPTDRTRVGRPIACRKTTRRHLRTVTKDNLVIRECDENAAMVCFTRLGHSDLVKQVTGGKSLVRVE